MYINIFHIIPIKWNMCISFWDEKSRASAPVRYYTAFIEYMDTDVRCAKKAVKLNHSLTSTALHIFHCIILLTEPSSKNFGEILIKIHILSLKKMHIKVSSVTYGRRANWLMLSVLDTF